MCAVIFYQRLHLIYLSRKRNCLSSMELFFWTALIALRPMSRSDDYLHKSDMREIMLYTNMYKTLRVRTNIGIHRYYLISVKAEWRPRRKWAILQTLQYKTPLFLWFTHASLLFKDSLCSSPAFHLEHTRFFLSYATSHFSEVIVTWHFDNRALRHVLPKI